MKPSFSSLHEMWFDGHRNRNSGVEAQLAKTYREAWKSGDTSDRCNVLHFIFVRRDQTAFDLILDGIRTGNASVGSEAAAIACCLLNDGFELGPSIGESLKLFGERLPEWSEISAAALRLLANRETTNQ